MIPFGRGTPKPCAARAMRRAAAAERRISLGVVIADRLPRMPHACFIFEASYALIHEHCAGWRRSPGDRACRRIGADAADLLLWRESIARRSADLPALHRQYSRWQRAGL